MNSVVRTSRARRALSAPLALLLAVTTSAGWWVTPVRATVAAGDHAQGVAAAGAPATADLLVGLAVSADPVPAGTAFDYAATVTNNGPGQATEVSASTTLSGVTRAINAATPSQGSCAIAPPTVTCALGNLAADATATIRINVTPASAGTLTATSTVAAAEPDLTPANNTDDENSTIVTPPGADIDVDLAAQPRLDVLVPYLRYTLTARDIGPDAVTSATVQAILPPGASATNLSSGCTAAGTTITCVYGAIPVGAGAGKTFRVPLSLLSLGQVTVTATRTGSAPADPDPANDRASATCTVVSIVLATCS
ncbi:DUF11 domain-containing protein [Nonomuraea sp. SBT364]|uniref:DUF11 domain-containing protein n=1 Tax=Nonomuraea sp. SBT364 TaxID=1580530 RepID=UPI00069EBCFE|nr:DUF11 domain-containing protein [Nonomuraea sp. SBT364]